MPRISNDAQAFKEYDEGKTHQKDSASSALEERCSQIHVSIRFPMP